MVNALYLFSIRALCVLVRIVILDSNHKLVDYRLCCDSCALILLFDLIRVKSDQSMHLDVLVYYPGAYRIRVLDLIKTMGLFYELKF